MGRRAGVARLSEADSSRPGGADSPKLNETRPAPAGTPAADLPRILKSLPHLTDEEADAFLKDIEEARAAKAKWRPRDPWES